MFVLKCLTSLWNYRNILCLLIISVACPQCQRPEMLCLHWLNASLQRSISNKLSIFNHMLVRPHQLSSKNKIWWSFICVSSQLTLFKWSFNNILILKYESFICFYFLSDRSYILIHITVLPWYLYTMDRIQDFDIKYFYEYTTHLRQFN